MSIYKIIITVIS